MPRSIWPVVTLLAIILPITNADEGSPVLELKAVLKKPEIEINTADVKNLLRQYNEHLKETPNKAGSPPPAAPVELRLQFHNISKNEIITTMDSDSNLVTLEVVGKGDQAKEVQTVAYPVAMTREFRLGRQVVIGPGKTFEVDLKDLEFGPRGKGSRIYFTAPGEYTSSCYLSDRR